MTLDLWNSLDAEIDVVPMITSWVTLIFKSSGSIPTPLRLDVAPTIGADAPGPEGSNSGGARMERHVCHAATGRHDAPLFW